WYARNFLNLVDPNDPITKLVYEITDNQPRGWDVLEYGCANGWRLHGINNMIPSRCRGVDPSKQAIKDGQIKYPGIRLEVGTVMKEFDDIDIMIYGFCLYLADRHKLSHIAGIGDAGLADGGHLIIHDFDPDHAHMVKYHHRIGLFSHKMDYSKLWL